MRIVGYYPQDSGSFLCPDCARRLYSEDDLAGRGENPYLITPVWEDSETDTLFACDECGECVIEESLTSEAV